MATFYDDRSCGLIRALEEALSQVGTPVLRADSDSLRRYLLGRYAWPARAATIDRGFEELVTQRRRLASAVQGSSGQ
jgi:hypothetical protein